MNGTIHTLTASMACVVMCLVAVAADGSPAAGPGPLIDALRGSGSSKVRAQAALALSSFPADDAIDDSLVAALGDSDRKVRAAAAKSLENRGAWRRFDSICEAAGAENDDFVSRWVAKAAVSAVRAAPVVELNTDGMRCSGGPDPEQATRNLQAAFLEVLLARNGYDISAALDYSSSTARMQHRTSLVIDGNLETAGDRSAGGARLQARASARNGYILWESGFVIEGIAAGAPEATDDRFADEYTIRDEPEDARLVAASAAGRRAAEEFHRALREPAGNSRSASRAHMSPEGG